MHMMTQKRHKDFQFSQGVWTAGKSNTFTLTTVTQKVRQTMNL